MTQNLQDELVVVEGKIQEILSLMREDWTDCKLQKARNRRDKHWRDIRSAYLLERKKKPVHTTMHTLTHLELGDALRIQIKSCQFETKLEDSLSKLSEQRVDVLERILESLLISKRSVDASRPGSY
jgi:hypothetical protein